ncbi:hypothetical protein SAMN04490244_107170 [Tranquillimonas rosea]|uniref:Uncharacterized protein n=1 Tax=Tranquillimonas rosea TaxID=641238 RepID=A0A1H9VJN3_9RHOB|nr:hypothetical protein [Tranquillimonas rosea]SES21915.1 hypothetical protein SAMN04490244_107170 [Tranquillimonas rosea]
MQAGEHEKARKKHNLREPAQEVLGSAEVGTGDTDSRPTEEEPTRDVAIDLIDGDRMCELLNENGLGVRTEMVERVRIDGAWFECV